MKNWSRAVEMGPTPRRKDPSFADPFGQNEILVGLLTHGTVFGLLNLRQWPSKNEYDYF